MFLFRCFLLIFLIAGFVPVSAVAQGLNVAVEMVGLDRDLRKELQPVASLARDPGSFSSLAPIRRAAELDAQALVAALQSKGFYAASVTPETRREETVAQVTFTVDRGPLFKVTGYELSYRDAQAGDRAETFEEMGLKLDGNPTGAALQKIERAALRHFWNNGFLGAEIVYREVRSDFTNGTAIAAFEIVSGPQGTYGEVLVQGVKRTDPVYVQQFRTFERGEIARRSDLDAYRERLVETSLFNEVEVLPQLSQEDGSTDILVRLAERKHRTLGGGLSFATDVGPSANAFWENRNFLRRGETLRADITVSQPVQEGVASFRKDRPRLPGYYNLAAALRNEDTDAFNAQTLEVGGSLAKLWFDRNLTTEGGVTLQYSKITEQQCLDASRRVLEVTEDTTCAGLGGSVEGEEDIFRALSFPMTSLWNSQDNLLDPQEGFLARLNVTPFVGTQTFQRIEVSYHDRVFWGPNDGGTLAGRFRLGAIYGASRADIPATERFYAGGGGSLRGYAFQEASPIDEVTGDILGGASTAEINLELRQHVTEALELAVFSDMGGAFEDNTPSFDNVLVGAGMGLRYHTPLGPIRLDVAIPLDRRRFTVPDRGGEDVGGDADNDPDIVFQDTSFQIYIGLGQPF